jgi:hypothetical protein
MDLAQEFQKHAADCELMAKLARDPESKTQWRELASRFRQCAKRAVQPAEPPISKHARGAALLS